MTPSIKVLLIFLLVSFTAKGQDIFDEINTSKFADYLFKTQQFELASQEYERLTFLTPANLDYKLFLLQSYRKNNNLTMAKLRFNQFYGNNLDTINAQFGAEYLKTSLLQKDFESARLFLNRNINIDTTTKLNYQLYTSVLNEKWLAADSIVQKYPTIDKNIAQYTYKALHMKHKSPFLAASMSTIIPGSGKIYTGYWKDGLISLLFVAANGWQTYRGFSNYGINKPHGWIFGGLATGFYFGNIYGSWKSAKKHNKILKDKIYNESQNYIYSSF